MMDKEFIYVRTHKSYEQYNAVKMGKTCNLLDRENTYLTGEIERGSYLKAFKVDKKYVCIIENLLQNDFKNDNIYMNGGKEFFNVCIIDKIEPFLLKNNFNYEILNFDDIKKLLRTQRVKKFLLNINKTKLIKILKMNSLQPRNYQIDIINEAHNYFKNNDKGILILPCGAGKTLTSLWIVLKSNPNNILIGVPSILLLHQWCEDINKLCNFKILCVFNTIDINDIKDFVKKHNKFIIITTYVSSLKIVKALKNFIFDFKILDEVHHLTNEDIEENKNSFVQVLNIKSLKQISLTATLKISENNENIISNNNIKYFGNIIVKKCLLWGIKLNIICDYVIKMVAITQHDINKIIPINITDYEKKLFLSAFTSLQSIYDKSAHHILIYSNTIENSKKIYGFIKFLLDIKYFNINNVYYSNYDGNMKYLEQQTILNNFNNSKTSIIICVYCLGEGYDNILIDEVIVSENMSSNIRIVQALLRAGRKNKNEPTKITKILLPILYDINWLEDSTNPDLLKVKQVIQKIGIEDETIFDKVKIINTKIKKNIKSNKMNEEKIIDYVNYNKFIQFISIPRNNIMLSYQQAKNILSSKQIKTKIDYLNFCENDKRFYTHPENHFKNFNWIEYLNIPKICYDLKTCKNKIEEYIIKNNSFVIDLDIILSKICDKDELMPPYDFFMDYYEILKLNDVMPNFRKNTLKELL